METTMNLEEQALKRSIRVHEPFAEFLKAKPALHTFEITLLDCYRLAGHACHSMTGAFLMTEAAVKELFPQTQVCERGDLIVEMGAQADEGATGPKSNVIAYITGAWGTTGFQGLKGEKFRRQDLLSFGHSDLDPDAIRFRRKSTGKTVVVNYTPEAVLAKLPHSHDFPDSWRVEICAILEHSDRVVQIDDTEADGCSSGCCC